MSKKSLYSLESSVLTPPKDLPRIDKKKQRTLSTDHQPQLDVYVAGPRVGPRPFKTKDDYAGEANKAARNAEQKNMLWILARQVNLDVQKVPCWTGFNIQTRDQVQVTADFVEYLPTINAPATELTTVFEILNQSEDIMKKLDLSPIVVVMDQALYAKTAEICMEARPVFEHCFANWNISHDLRSIGYPGETIWR